MNPKQALALTVTASSWPLSRRLEPELMDQPGLDPGLHHQALRGLSRLHALTGTSGLIWRTIRRRLQVENGGEPLTFLDLACGSGDLAIQLFRRARRAGLPLVAQGWDINPVAVRYATQRSLRAGLDVTFVHRDVLSPSDEQFDVVVCSLFLHHLDQGQTLQALRWMARATRRLLVINDLDRRRLAAAAVWLGSRLVTRSPIVHVDAVRSVQAAWTRTEMLALAAEAGLEGARIRRRWPFGYLLLWEPSP